MNISYDHCVIILWYIIGYGVIGGEVCK